MTTIALSLSDIFDSAVTRDPTQFHFKFSQLATDLRVNDAAYDVNELVSNITETLSQTVQPNENKFEETLYSLPWARFLFQRNPPLDPKVFARLFTEYVEMYRNKSEKFLHGFIFVLRGDSTLGNSTQITDRERNVFAVLKTMFGSLVSNVNFESILVREFKRKFPFFHNANTHEYVCYVFNLIEVIEVLQLESAGDLFCELTQKILEVDVCEFFEDCDRDHIFAFEDEDGDIEMEKSKKLKVIDAIFGLLFAVLESKISVQNQNQQPKGGEEVVEEWNRYIELVTRVFLERILSSGQCSHAQYLIFYLCGKSRTYCDTMVNDLWALATSEREKSPIVRQNSFSLLLSLLLNARFIPTLAIFSILKAILQCLGQFLTRRRATNSTASSESDFFFHLYAIGFCRLFCAFHGDLERFQIECLKNLDMKRIIMNQTLNSVQFMPADLRETINHLSSHYRIGYMVTEVRERKLHQAYPNIARASSLQFGRIYLKSVRAAVEPLCRNVDLLDQVDSVRTPRKMNRGRIPASPTSGFTSTSDDQLMLSPNTTDNSFTPSSSMIMSHMLSDEDLME